MNTWDAVERSKDDRWHTQVEMNIDGIHHQLGVIETKLDAIGEKLTARVEDHRVIVSQIPSIQTRIETLDKDFQAHVKEFSVQKGKLSVWLIVLTLVLSGVFGYFFSTINKMNAPSHKARTK
jgi:hypothetical protein